uniref:General transcription factor 3C polypeptide 2 n=1 Tax=Lygus hesperus TaxID=30085 RepID=A0A0A9YYT6_LYGHE
MINLKAPQQYPSAKSRLASLSPGIAEHPRLASILLKTDGKMQVPSTLKLVRVVPPRKPNTTKPFVPLEPSASVVPSPIAQNNSYGIENICSSVGTPDITEDFNVSSFSYSSMPFELPVLPPPKSIFSKPYPISDDHNGIDSQSSAENLHKSDYRLIRTYGRNRGSTQNSGNRLLIVENGMMTDEEISHTDRSGIFTDEMDVYRRDGDSVEDPLNIEEQAAPEVKTEPIDDYEDCDPSRMFHDSYDIFTKAEDEEECIFSYPYDSTIPFDVICESTEAISGGLYNDRCPWEQAQKKKKSDKNDKIHNKNPYRSKNLLAKGICDSHTPKLFGNEIVSLTGPTHECNLIIPDPNGVIDNADKETFDALSNHLVDPHGVVNEPMIYAVDKIIYDNSSKLCDLRTDRMESKIARCVQNNLMDEAEEGKFSSSNCRNNLYMINHYGEMGNHIDEFLELVNYLTHYERHFVNEPMVYAVDKIVYDNKKNETESKSKKGKRASSGEQSSRNSLPPQVDSPELSVASRKSRGRGSERSNATQLPTSDEGVAFRASKRKRKSTTSVLRKNLIDEDISLEESAEALLSLGQNNGSNAVDETETNVLGTEPNASMNMEEPTSKRSKITHDERRKTSDVGKPESATSHDTSTDPVTTFGSKRSTRKSTRLVEPTLCVEQGCDESPETETTRKKRSSRKVVNTHAVEEIAPGVIVPLPQEDNESDEEKPRKRKGRPPKRKSRSVLKGINVPKSSFGVDDQPRGSPESMLYIPGDDDPESDELVPADRRIIFSSPLVDPHKLVECAVCGDSMTAAVYKKEHVIRHNHLCWLKGEEPMDLEDEKGVERYLYRIYLKTRAPFTCEICGIAKKSALGFVTHKKFCGKSAQERKELMVSCTICSRVLLPSSLHNHMIKTHPAIASVPEEPPVEGRLAASRCLDVLSTNAKDINNDLEYIDENEELQAADKNNWIRHVYAFCNRRIQKEQRSIIEEAAQGSQIYRCVIASCDFSDRNITNVIEHYRACDKEPLDCKCKECPFMTNSEVRMINHIRMTHFNKAKEYSSKKFSSGEIADVSEVAGAFIPYIKSGELGSRSMLYLQPALYWTRDLRADKFSMDPIFLDWDVAGDLELEKAEELDPYLRLRDESVRIKPSEASSSWSVLKKFTSESFNDDVQILFTGGVVRAFDWFPTTSSQYLAVSVGSFDSENISAAPVHSSPGHFQIWSAGTLDNLSESYAVDPRLYLAVCHEFGEIWDIECCPSGGQTDKRLGLVAIGTSSGAVAVYSIPLLDECSEERATRLEPVTILKLGIQKSYQVSKISWSKTKPHRFIAAGFTNGLVAILNLTTSSTLLKSGNTILPFKSFHPHLAIITALSFCPLNEYYIATGCAEKSSKFWNLHDTTYNHGEFTRGLVTDVAWLPHWMAALNSLDVTTRVEPPL